MQNKRLHLETNGQRDALRDAIEKDGPTTAALLAHSECLSPRTGRRRDAALP